jgi:ABC-type Na+ efflux pump permease subunit
MGLVLEIIGELILIVSGIFLFLVGIVMFPFLSPAQMVVCFGTAAISLWQGIVHLKETLG